MVIAIDTREQRPWGFPEGVTTVRKTLKQGDYAVDGDAHYAIERKSLNDFLGTIFSQWGRFLREIGRMEGAEFVQKVVLVEADFWQVMYRQNEKGEILPPVHDHPMLTPQAVAARIAELSMLGVQVMFCHDAEYAALQAFALLCNRNAQLATEGDHHHDATGQSVKHTLP